MKKKYITPETESFEMNIETVLADTSVDMGGDPIDNNEALAKPVELDFDNNESITLVPYKVWKGFEWDEEIGIRRYINIKDR